MDDLHYLGGGVVSVLTWQHRRAMNLLREDERRRHPELFRDELTARVWDYRSRARLFGLPLVHWRSFGQVRRPGEKIQPAVGWIAIGEKAYGILYAGGGIAVGGISTGGLSIGLLSFGGFSIGLLALGGFSLGGLALGGAAIGLVASGGMALGWRAAQGGLVAAHELACGGAALGNHVNDAVARDFFINHHWLDFHSSRPAQPFFGSSASGLWLSRWLYGYGFAGKWKAARNKIDFFTMQNSKIKKLLAAILALQIFTAFADPVSDRITVTVRGKGPDVVLIPGLASSGAVWDATAKQLENRFRLHIVQGAGFAGSPVRANATGAILQPTVDALDFYIKTNHLQSPDIIGHSLGGLVGMMLVLQHPEDAGKLMVVDSLPFFGVLSGAKNVAAVTPQAAMMRDFILNQTQAAYARLEKNNFSEFRW